MIPDYIEEARLFMEGPLSGIKVVDLSTFVAAPVCGRLMADMGATVIKVERPEGDAWRQTGISYNRNFYTHDKNPVFDIYNSGKEHIALNLKSPEGMQVMHQLLAEADVFITNTRPAALKRLGLAYEDLKDKYPGLVYGILLGYGEAGPDADKPAFDTSAFWSRSGFLRDMAPLTDEYQPVLPPFSAGDTGTGILLMGQICAALLRKQKTGKGDYIRSGLFHNGIFTFGTMAIVTQPDGGAKQFPTTRIDYGLPGGTYQCSDGEWIFIATSYYEILVEQLCKTIGREDLMTDPKFDVYEHRVRNKQEYYEIFKNAFLQKPSTYWLEQGAQRDIPIVRLNHFSELCTDEQAWANGYLENVTFPDGTTGVMPTSPIEMDSVGTIVTQPAPKVGANTEEILQRLGYTPEQIRQMKEAGAIK